MGASLVASLVGELWVLEWEGEDFLPGEALGEGRGGRIESGLDDFLCFFFLSLLELLEGLCEEEECLWGECLWEECLWEECLVDGVEGIGGVREGVGLLAKGEVVVGGREKVVIWDLRSVISLARALHL